MGRPVSLRPGLALLSLLAVGAFASGSFEATSPAPAVLSAPASQGTVAPRRATLPPGPPPKLLELPLALARDRELPADTVHSYGFPLERGQALRVDFEQRGIDLEVKVVDPEETPIVRVDGFSGSLGTEPVVIVAARSGRHRLLVSRAGKAVPEGRYRISAWSTRPGTELDRACQDAAREYAAGREGMKGGADLAGAEAHFLAARASYRKCGSPAGEADSLLKLIGARALGKKFGSVVALAPEANRLFRKLGEDPRQVLALLNFGFAYGWLYDQERARTYYAASIARSEAVSGQLEKLGPRARARLGEVRKWEVLARLYLGLATDFDTDLRSTLSSLERAADLAREFEDVKSEGMVLATLGSLYLEFGDFERAFEAERAAKALFERSPPDPQWELQSQGTWARIYFDIGLPERAALTYKKLLPSYEDPGAERQRAEVLNGLSLALYRLDRFEEGLQTAERARKLYSQLGDRRGEAAVLANELWFLSRLERFEEARQAYRQAVALGALPRGSKAEVGLLFGLADLERTQGNLEAAQRLIERILANVEGMGAGLSEPKDRSLLRSTLGDAYDFWIELLLQREALEPGRGWGLRSFAESDRIRGRAIREASRRRIRAPLAEPPSSPERAENLRLLLDEQTVLLHYHLSEMEGFLWIVTREKVRGVRLSGRNRLETKVGDLRAALAEGDQVGRLEKARVQAVELSKVLLQPAAPELAVKRKVLIAVPSVLEYVPFAVLPFPIGGPAKGIWPTSLSTGHEVVSIPSLSAALAAREAAKRRPAAPKLFALIDDPVTDREDSRLRGSGRTSSRRGAGEDGLERGPLRRLKHAQDQAEALIAMAGEQNVFRLTGFRARRDTFLSKKWGAYRHLLFVTHGLWKKGDPQGASLALSLFDEAGRPIDGFLTARDIEKLDLRCELVVLSGCSTGLGRQVWGEGLAGVSQAFLQAGARRVVVSLWEVNDEATAELMSLFYRGLLERRLAPAAALREAQDSLRQQPRWSSPYYWGSFVLKGDWN